MKGLRMNRELRYILAFFALCVLFVLGSSVARAEEPIKLGFAMAQSGWMQVYDEHAYRGAMVKVEELNRVGGLLGRKIETLRRDTKTDRAEGVKAGQALLDDGVVMLMVSGDYNMGAPIALAAEKAGTISFFAAAEDVKAGLQGVGPLSFNAAASNAVAVAATLGEWAYNLLKVRRPYLLLDTTIDYNKATCRGFDWIFAQYADAKPVGSDTFKNADPSIASQITRIKSLPTPPDAIALCSYVPGAATAIRQLRAAGLDMPILANDALDGTFWHDAVPGVSKVFIAVQGSVRGDDPRPLVNAFSENYKHMFGVAPDQQTAISGYVAIDLWARAVTKAKSFDAQKVKEALESFQEAKVLTNARTFTSKLHITNQPDLLIQEARGGQQKTLGFWKLSKEVPLSVLTTR